uniref:Uncharacterized protein n=1 Tax=Arundo donax TaxID=35708 RepID=A0A0A9BFM2_ARUDO
MQLNYSMNYGSWAALICCLVLFHALFSLFQSVGLFILRCASVSQK